ncbi:hypothetical protein TOPH_02572 [Tolypocladium ophioglossoides CBS 100239]|uniref:Uncharacterized protein n=1 Tax=Tolypocladium ophioglossoides (strain CBS 100239) TaxID=1163406 RepID=A0A0L0NFL8_TOLOC|nr:hypothetical protein TOPH_02572 [Tolypocladium ophioglossoides CBS 100239]
MSRLFGLRTARFFAAGGVYVGAAMLSNPRVPLRLDSGQPVTARSRQRQQPPGSSLSPQLVRQVSSGSLAGFAAGFFVALFSRTLVFLGGLLAVSLHIASCWGLGVPRLAGINQQRWPGLSSVGRLGADNPWFTSSFALTFILAAFVRL